MVLVSKASVSSCCQSVLPNMAQPGPVILIKTNFMCSYVIVIFSLNFKWKMLVKESTKKFDLS
jgi:hypothetical protein